MNKFNENFEIIKEDITNFILVIVSITLIPAFSATIYRSYKIGWDNSIYLIISIILVLFIFTYFRKKISYKIKALTIIFFCYIVGINDLLIWSFAGSGVIFLLFAPIVITMIFGYKKGVLAGLFSAVSIGLIGFGIVNEYIIITTNLNNYNLSSSSWISIGVDFLSFGVVIIGILGIFQNMFLENIKNLNLKSDELETALNEVKTLKSIIPICSNCKKIRDDSGNWDKLENYILQNTDSQFSHGICNNCLAEHYPNIGNNNLTE